MVRRKITYLIVDDDADMLESSKFFIEKDFPEIKVTLTKSIAGAMSCLKKPFNIVSCDILMPSGMIKNSHGRVTEIRPIEFLKNLEIKYPQTHLAVISGIEPKEKLKGIKFFNKLELSPERMGIFLKEVIQNPWKKPSVERIDLEQFMRPMLHVDPATGRKRLIQIVKSAAARDDKTLLNMMRAGYRPPGKEQAIRNLEISLAHSGTHGRERKLLGNALARLKRPRIMK